VSDGDVIPQKAHIDLVELNRAVLEDAVIRVIPLAESGRVSGNHPVGVGMLRLYGLSAFPQETGYADEVGIRRKQLTERIQIVAIPSCLESRDSATHVLIITGRRSKSAGDQQGVQHGHSSEHGPQCAPRRCHG